MITQIRIEIAALRTEGQQDIMKEELKEKNKTITEMSI